MRLSVLIFFFFLSLLFLPPPSWALTILNDDFNNLNYIDVANTTAEVDTVNGWVVLKSQSLANAIDVRRDGWEYAVATKNGIEVYTFDAAVGSLVKNNALSISSETTAIGVACRDDSPSIWSLTPDSLTLYKYNAGGMQTSPAQNVTGLTNVLSVSSWNGLDKAAVLTKTGDNKAKVEIYRDVSGTVNNVFTLNTNLLDPVALCTVPNTPDFILSTKTATYYYSYDDSTANYIQHPAKQALGLSGLKAVSAKDDGSFVALENSDANFYMFSVDGGALQANVLSQPGLSNPVSISIKPGQYEYAVLNSSGDVDYWTYDGTGMVKNNTLSVSGLSLNQGYIAPADYWSIAISAGNKYDQARITANTNLPMGTSIKFYLSSDGGSTFTEVTNGIWKAIPSGNNFVARAVLDTTDTTVTPKILNITLEVSTLSISNLRVLAIAMNDPSQVLPTSTFPVKVKMGAEMLFEVITSGFANQVTSDFTNGMQVILTPLNPTTSENNTWRGRFTVPLDAVDGATIGVTLTARSDTNQKQLTQNPFILINGQVLYQVDLKLTQ